MVLGRNLSGLPGVFGGGGVHASHDNSAVYPLRRALARALDLQPGGPLSEALHAQPQGGLAGAFAGLSPGAQRALTQRWGSHWRGALHLSSGNHPEILSADLLFLGRQWEESGDPAQQQAALILYEGLSQSRGAGAREAGERLAALEGRGPWGRRLKNFGRHFFQQAADPALLGSLLVGNLVFKGTYLRLFQGLGRGGPAATWTGLWGRRLLAGTGALLAEGPAMVMADVGLRRLGGDPFPLQAQALGPQILSTYITLGSLRLSGALSRGLVGARLRGSNSLPQMFMPHASMLAGVYGAFSLEESLGLRPQRGASDRLLASFKFFAHAQFAGHLSRRLMGRRLENFERSLDQQIQAAQFQLTWPSLAPTWALAHGAAGAGGGRLRPDSGPRTDHLAMAVSHQGPPPGPRGRPGRPLSPEVIENRLENMVRPSKASGQFENNEVPAEGKGGKVQSIGVLTSGGDGPGENAAIEALVVGARETFGWEVRGILGGYKGLLEPKGNIVDLEVRHVQSPSGVREAYQQIYGVEGQPRHMEQRRSIKYLGGNILGSSRTNPLQMDSTGEVTASRVQETMKQYHIDALVVLGGNGSQRAARDLHLQGVPLAFIPQSIDADVPGSVVSLGFPSAVNRGALGLSEYLNTAQSCQRWFLVEVMGQRYGGLTLGVAYSASRGRAAYEDFKEQPPVHVGGLFTEIPRSLAEIPQLIESHGLRGMDHGVLLISEGVQFREGSPPRDADARSRLLVEAGDVARWVREKLLDHPYQTPGTRAVSMGYALRGARPTLHDRILARHFADGALKLIERGSFGRMTGLEFIGDSAVLRPTYPRIGDAVGRPVLMHPQYLSHIRRSLEEPVGDGS